ncbi:MAG: CDP-glucose 4,6-dehydratase [Planctomycetota bacterium]
MTFNNTFKDRRVLVTGHTGFKGGWLALWLLELGADVVGYALEPDTEPSLFRTLEMEKDIEHHIGDVRDYNAVQRVVETFRPEIVFHLAAQPLVRRSYRLPKETFDINIGGTVNVLEAIRHIGCVRSCVVITTDKVYKNQEWVWGYREIDPMGGSDPYSASKGAAEIVIGSYIRSFFGEKNCQTCCASVRAGNVIGGGDYAEDRILPDAVRAMLNGTTLGVRNPASTRPWQFVLEPLSGYLALAQKQLEDPEHFSGAWNFGPRPDDVQTVEQIVKSFYNILGRGNYEDLSSRQAAELNESRMLTLCCDKANHQLKWTPVYSILEAVRRTAKWYEAVLLDQRNAREICVEEIRTFVEMAAKMGSLWAK